MKVSRERLQIIGRMIGVLREEKRQNKQNNWTQIKFCENICSPNTLKSIESGKVGRSDDIYEQLLEKLGLKYGEFSLIDQALVDLFDKLYFSIEYFNVNEIIKCTNKGLVLLNEAKDYVYYSECFLLFQNVKKYYIEDEMISEVNVNRYLEEMDCFCDNARRIMKLLVFGRIKVYCMTNKEMYLNYFKRLAIDEDEKTICLMFILLHKYYICGEFLDMNMLLDSLEKKCLSKNNKLRLLDVYSNRISLFVEVDRKMAEQSINKVINLIENSDINCSAKIQEVISIIGDFYYYHKEYEKALDFYKTIHINENISLVPKLIHMIDCQRKLGLDISIPELTNANIKKLPYDIKCIYNFFLIDDVPDFVKENYIMKKVVPILNDEWLIRVFKNELKILVKKNGKYKLLSDFDDKFS